MLQINYVSLEREITQAKVCVSIREREQHMKMREWGVIGELRVLQNNLCQAQGVVFLREKALEVQRSEPLKAL